MSTLEQEHVYKMYSCIAQHFSDTRVNQWKWITDFINVTAKSDKRILDLSLIHI